MARAVLPKFYVEDVDMEAWKVFSTCDERVVVTKMPRIMVERFVKEHLRGDEVVGCELVVNRFGLATGFVIEGEVGFGHFGDKVGKMVAEKLTQPTLGLGRAKSSSSFLSLCKEQMHPPFMMANRRIDDQHVLRPLPVIFHDGRLVRRPTPSTALLILLWMPLGILLAFIRIIIGLLLPMWAKPIISRLLGTKVIVKGKPPQPPSLLLGLKCTNSGVLFVCTHRTLMDPVVLSTVLHGKIPAVSRFSELLSPIPTIRLTRTRHLDADKINRQLSKGDLVVCSEGTTCREPFLLRFSALFAELSDRIVPVAMNYQVGFFHATTARGCKGLDPIFFFMNPRPVYEVTFLNELPAEATCSAGKSAHEVANYVQRILAATLGFECTSFTRKDKYNVLAGNDRVVERRASLVGGVMKVVRSFMPLNIEKRKER